MEGLGTHRVTDATSQLTTQLHMGSAAALISYLWNNTETHTASCQEARPARSAVCLQLPHGDTNPMQEKLKWKTVRRLYSWGSASLLVRCLYLGRHHTYRCVSLVQTINDEEINFTF